jgi:hypothetical protein
MYENDFFFKNQVLGCGCSMYRFECGRKRLLVQNRRRALEGTFLYSRRIYSPPNPPFPLAHDQVGR